MTVVGFTGEQQFRDYLKERIADARATLSTLPILKALVEDFKPLENEPRIHSVVFWKCVYARSGFGGQPDIISNAEVSALEGLLKELDVLNWAPGKKDALANKLKSNTLEHSLASYTEATVAGHLAKKFGSNRIEYEPSLISGGFGDIKLNGSAQPVYIEVTALTIRETERKFNTIFEKVAEYVFSRISQEICVHIEIETGVLPASKEGIDVDGSVRMITDFLEHTKLISLFAPDFSLHGFKYLAQLDHKQSLYDQKLLLQHYSSELCDNIEKEPVRTFAKSLTGRDFVSCPIAYFWCVSGKHPVVDVADEGVSPSGVASLEREAFLRHVERRLKEELNQMQIGEINMIVLRASNWSIIGYEKGRIETDFQFPTLRTRIEQFMKKEANPNLSAIVAYEDNFANAQIIMSPASSGRSKTTYEFIEGIVR